MSETGFATGDAQTKKVWEEKLFRETIVTAYFSDFMGNDAESMVHTRTDLTKQKGDLINFGMVGRLSGPGVTGDTVLKGQEEALSTFMSTVSLEQYRNGVSSRGRLSRQRAFFDISDEARIQLKQWMSERIDRLCFNALIASPTFIAYRDASGVSAKTTSLATAKAALSAANSKLTLDFFPYLRTLAKTGNDRQFIPIRPIRIKGKDYYVLLCHEDVLFDIKIDNDFQAAQREAQQRGEDHPLFRGATAVYDQVIVHAHEFMPKAEDGGGAAVSWAQCALVGAQSLAWAWGERPFVETDVDDYGNKQGWSINMIAGVKKPVFNSFDYGSIGVALARTKVSG